MIAAVLVLSALFESKIYLVSSLFIGFILGAIPLIISEEKKNIKIGIKNVICLLAGIAVVALITYYNSRSESAGMDLSVFSLTEGIKLFSSEWCPYRQCFCREYQDRRCCWCSAPICLLLRR